MMAAVRRARGVPADGVVTVVLAIAILGEAFTLWHALGTALVLGGVFLFTRKEKPRLKVLEEQTG